MHGHAISITFELSEETVRANGLRIKSAAFCGMKGYPVCVRARVIFVLTLQSSRARDKVRKEERESKLICHWSVSGEHGINNYFVPQRPLLNLNWFQGFPTNPSTKFWNRGPRRFYLQIACYRRFYCCSRRRPAVEARKRKTSLSN